VQLNTARAILHSVLSIGAYKEVKDQLV